MSHAELVTGVNAIKQNADALNNAMGTLKQQIQANSQYHNQLTLHKRIKTNNKHITMQLTKRNKSQMAHQHLY